ncbi:hypothetical protein BDZ91DRAFT_380258 [Kalaharituber pfeilii]|nr:hypothetical protein BDZ91DRAFT_380258 [Kalaharituber pfeilii]
MDPWSIRQTGFYQKFDTNSRNSSSIIIEPSDVLRGRLGEVFGEGSSQAIRSDYPTHWTTFPLLCLSAVGGNWREYIRFLGIGIENIHTIFRFEQLGEKGTSRFTEVTFADLKRLEYFMDTGLRVAHVLNLNIEVMKAIQHDAERIRALEEKEANSERYTILAQAIDSKIREHNFLRKHIQSLCNRAERTSGMIRDAIALRDSATMKELARLANIETAQVHNLTEKTVKDTKAMKVLTFMAVIYLPASFTASFFGMDYVTVRTHAGGRISVHATENLWLYIAITAPLMVLTLGACFCGNF